jgi:hypothetical protein
MAKKARPHSRAQAHTLVLGTYTAAVFLSALLLFGVQPMFTRMVLPRFGGSPSVWSVAMVFFQSMLLAGYAYAHVLTTLRQRYAAVAIHLLVLIGAASMLPLAIAQGWDAPLGTAAAVFWLLGLFAVSIGVPFFALAANNPLLQAWFASTGHHDARDPYFLYAASNVGSFAALLCYPVMFEPIFSLQTQNWLWSIGFLLLIVLIGSCGLLMLRVSPRAARLHVKSTSVPSPSWTTIGRWIFISAVPSGLLIAVTAYISTDVAAAPLLWVIPLSLYLLTWVLVFQRRPLIAYRISLLLQPVAVAGIVLLLSYPRSLALFFTLTLHLVAFFIIALTCHAELARSRPAPRHLTTFYVSLSFGGMVGGLFSGLVAPYAFSTIAEYPILAVLAVLCRPFTQEEWKPFSRWLWPLALSYRPEFNRSFWPIALPIALLLMVGSYDGFTFAGSTDFFTIVVVTLTIVSMALLRDPPKSAFVVAVAFAVVFLYPTYGNQRETLRSFFGVHKIFETDDGRYRVLLHGSTIHGAQLLETENGEPVAGSPVPITYYHDNSAINQVIRAVREHKHGPMRVAVIGLGTGTLACRIAPGEAWRFFEIDPTVIAIARDPKRFSFLSSCAPDVPIVLGDARLTFAQEPPQFYDLIIVDAYSSDAIPIHLATAEAMAIYKSKLAPHGVVMMHISNRHLDLKSVVEGIAAANRLKTWIWTNDNEKYDDANYVFTSDVAISAQDVDDLGALAHDKLWVLTAPNPALRTWTDDYSNIAGAIWRKYNK